jgi:hypothetical protein
VPTPAWTATDGSGNLAYKWREQPSGSALRLSLLRIHMSEVSAALSTGNYTDESENFNKDLLQRYYQDLVKDERQEAAASGPASGNRTSWTRGKLL